MNEHTKPIDIEWQETCKRFICFMDIMGFKDMVARKEHNDIKTILEKMSQLKNVLEITSLGSIPKGRTEHEQRVKSVIFSDSILFITKDDSFSDLLVLADILKTFSEAIIQTGVAPTKGATSFGNFTANFKSSIFFGQPLIDAYLLQNELFYYGVILDHHVESVIIEALEKNPLLEKETNEYFDRLMTPLKTGKINHYNVKMKNISQDQLNNLYKTVSGGVRKYVDNTIETYKLMNVTA